jgi:hypothetical protein
VAPGGENANQRQNENDQDNGAKAHRRSPSAACSQACCERSTWGGHASSGACFGLALPADQVDGIARRLSRGSASVGSRRTWIAGSFWKSGRPPDVCLIDPAGLVRFRWFTDQQLGTSHEDPQRSHSRSRGA